MRRPKTRAPSSQPRPRPLASHHAMPFPRRRPPISPAAHTKRRPPRVPRHPLAQAAPRCHARSNVVASRSASQALGGGGSTALSGIAAGQGCACPAIGGCLRGAGVIGCPSPSRGKAGPRGFPDWEGAAPGCRQRHAFQFRCWGARSGPGLGVTSRVREAPGKNGVRVHRRLDLIWSRRVLLLCLE